MLKANIIAERYLIFLFSLARNIIKPVTGKMTNEVKGFIIIKLNKAGT